MVNLLDDATAWVHTCGRGCDRGEKAELMRAGSEVRIFGHRFSWRYFETVWRCMQAKAGRPAKCHA